ncbi:neutral amino acid transporter [Colletotrichum fioriniae PJ7]|uniref:Neutral amino acid transporter n=1 Tax=Colletotrichum fioriniae PJ7 TaxID=1445577 RepID=A0A010SH49_9PEZI|nr:neutral amino acid transporter [Colletotrichum fioriniae PJ7]
MPPYTSTSLEGSSEKMEPATNGDAFPERNTKTECIDIDDNREVFHEEEYRALGWKRTGIILMKLCFATGVLTIPSAFSSVGIADAAALMGGPIAREIAGGLFLLTWILASGSGFIGLAQGFKTLSNRHVCNIAWTLVAATCTAIVSSIPTLGRLSVLAWIGFASIFTAVFIVVVGVTQVERPAAAPQTGPYDMEVHAVGAPGFVPGVVAAVNLFTVKLVMDLHQPSCP